MRKLLAGLITLCVCVSPALAGGKRVKDAKGRHEDFKRRVLPTLGSGNDGYYYLEATSKRLPDGSAELALALSGRMAEYRVTVQPLRIDGAMETPAGEMAGIRTQVAESLAGSEWAFHQPTVVTRAGDANAVEITFQPVNDVPDTPPVRLLVALSDTATTSSIAMQAYVTGSKCLWSYAICACGEIKACCKPGGFRRVNCVTCTAECGENCPPGEECKDPIPTINSPQ